MILLNKEFLRDKIHACFIGKNIGGTIGTPFEGKIGPHDVRGFNSAPGEPLPNDDLDLQLIWLCAIEQNGARMLTPTILGEYWLDAIPPHWNEYGICKANLRNGLLPPLSGHFNNERWRDSNGAWIRSEIWACLCPGLPNVAMKYALMDAMNDHGKGEGTVAEMFTAAMQSLAFFENDIFALLEKALEYIPEESRISRCVRLVMREYKAGTSWLECREKILEETSDMTTFQAPANVAYAVLGLLYGEGDFKKSVILATNCGDDTDCTAATVGATMGIMGGTAAIPEDWRAYIGDRILTVAIDGSFWFQPKSCTELTERILVQLPGMFVSNGYEMEYTSSENVIDTSYPKWYSDNEYNAYDYRRFFERYNDSSPYSNEFIRGSHEAYLVDYMKEPYVRPMGEFKLKITIYNHRRHPLSSKINLLLPDGWTAEYPKNIFVGHKSSEMIPKTEFEVVLHAPEKVDAVNQLAIIFTSSSYPAPYSVPIILLG